jgi:hypothetical protein
MRYYFKESFPLVCNGQDNDIEYIEIPAPTAEIIGCCDLEEEMNKVIAYTAKNRDQFLGDEDVESIKAKNDEKKAENKDEEKKVDNGEQIGYMLAMADGDLKRCYTALHGCITKTKCKLNGEIPCTPAIYRSIPYKELKGLLGEYIVNFISSLQ